ncbi:Flp family type IVb pilin [Arthrobacter sp. B1805]|uniref:Flp family type IVb pilin n=1 Tax=Arthrobacter sp. B1805 TaxID=2058892 RepID=UPI002157FFDA|nr:Flp family type IVb pilin [Arthrobacter sp. B1805]
MFLVSNTRMNVLPRLVRKEDGATAVEYGIMVALIAVVIIAAVTLLGGNLQGSFQSIACQIQGQVVNAAGDGCAAPPAP